MGFCFVLQGGSVVHDKYLARDCPGLIAGKVQDGVRLVHHGRFRKGHVPVHAAPLDGPRHKLKIVAGRKRQNEQRLAVRP